MAFSSGDTSGYAAAKSLIHAPRSHYQYPSGTTNIRCRATRGNSWRSSPKKNSSLSGSVSRFTRARGSRKNSSRRFSLRSGNSVLMAYFHTQRILRCAGGFKKNDGEAIENEPRISSDEGEYVCDRVPIGWLDRRSQPSGGYQ